jgi:hypothetical protein
VPPTVDDDGAQPEESVEESTKNTERSAPSVTPLSAEERQAVLPASATGAQYAYFWGPFDASLQRFFASLLAGLLASGLPLLAVPASLYFLWAPLALAARRNAPLRRLPYAGLWHCRVLSAQVTAAEPGGALFDHQGDAFLPRRRASTLFRVLLGDDSGARLRLDVPFSPEQRGVREGDAAEVLVLSDDSRLRRLRALREAYLPEMGLWLCEYPFAERSMLEALSDSLAIEESGD